MPKPQRPSAASRTVDMFSGQTAQEQAMAAAEVIPETSKGSENIEQAAERWRNNAIFTAEHLSKHFNDGLPNDEVFRLTQKDEWLFLEKFSHSQAGKAYHWTGLMFKTDNLYELTNVFVKASKERQAKNG